MVYFQTPYPTLGKFWGALVWKVLIYFMAIWNSLRAFEMFYNHLVHLVFIWYIFSVMYHENSGNPGGNVMALKSILKKAAFLIRNNFIFA
jgi:hypothetical protein